MSQDVPKPMPETGASPAPKTQPALTLLKLDPDKYRKHLADFDLTEEEQNELLATLWQIMRGFVELGWGLDSVQLLSTEKTASDSGKSSRDSGTVPQTKDHSLSFEQTTEGGQS